MPRQNSPASRSHLLIVGIVLVALVVAAATADAQGRDPRRAVANNDANGDGRVSRDEWKGPPARFGLIDKNKDGFLTAEEFAQFWGVPMPEGTAPDQGAKRAAARPCIAEPVSPSGEYVIEHYAPACSFEGTTLFADTSNPEWSRLVEIDMRGKVVWELKVAGTVGGLSKGEYPLDVERLANGNTLFTVKGKGVYEVDRSGRLIWRHEDADISHDADRLPNGNTLVVRGWIGKGSAHVQEITPDGRVAWSWDGVAQYDRPPYDAIDREGWIHANAATRMPDGSTWISLRNFDVVARVAADGNVLAEIRLPVAGTRIPDGIQKRHAASGQLAVVMPHDPEVQANGNLLIPHAGVGGLIVETDATGQRQVWRRFWRQGEGISHIRDANRLPNGNILVSSGSRLLEITSAGDIVWQMKRASIGDKPSNNQQFFKAQRIAPNGKAYGG